MLKLDRPNLLCWTFVLCLAWLLQAGLVAAQEETSPANAGMACAVPQLDITWRGYDDAVLKISSTSTHAPKLWVVLFNPYCQGEIKVDDTKKAKICAEKPAVIGADNYLNCDQKGENYKKLQSFGEPFCVKADSTGTLVSLKLERKPLYEDAGFLGIRYLPGIDGPGECTDTLTGPPASTMKALEKHTASFKAGLVYGLNGDGSWKSDFEAGASLRSRWVGGKVLGSFDLRYSNIAEAEESGDGEEEGEEGEDAAAEADEPKPEEFDPLAAGGGVLESTSAVSYFFAPRLAVTGGFGYRTIPGSEESKPVAAASHFYGFRLEIEGFNSGDPAEDSLADTSGWLMIAYSKDDFYDHVELVPASGDTPAVFSDESKRWWLEGELDIPGVGNKWAKLRIRAFLSFPQSGDGPSDIRLSALVRVDPRKWFKVGGSS